MTANHDAAKVPRPVVAGPEMEALGRLYRDVTWTGVIHAGGMGPGTPAMTGVGRGRAHPIQDGRWIVLDCEQDQFLDDGTFVLAWQLHRVSGWAPEHGEYRAVMADNSGGMISRTRQSEGPVRGTVARPASAGRVEPYAGGRRVPGMGSDVMVAGGHRQDTSGGWLRLGLRVAGAVLLAVSAGFHLDLYLTGYRSIPTIGGLFLLQVIVGFALAAAVLVTRGWLVAAAGAGFALATLGGFLLSVWLGLFGFKEVRTTAGIAAGLIEVAAFTALALTALLAIPARQGTEPVSPAARLLARVRAAAPMVMAAVGGISVLAVILLGVAVAGAGGPAASAAGASVTLKTAKIGGVTVLTNAGGLTLYWFAPDTAATSKCTGSCAAYWPPVTGSPQAGPGVTGKLGTIKRPDGGVQAAYDGHPLYTYIGDSGPGQAHGNNLNLNGGLWYEVRASG